MKIIPLLMLVLAVVTIGCQNTKPTATVNGGTTSASPAMSPVVAENSPTAKKDDELIFDLKELANKSPEQVDSVLGKGAIKVTPIPADRDLGPGEYRDYQFDSADQPMQVRFHKGKAVHFVFWANEANSRSTSSGFAKRFGLTTGVSDRSGNLSEQWEGIINGVNFKSVMVARNSPTTGFATLNATVQE